LHRLSLYYTGELCDFLKFNWISTVLLLLIANRRLSCRNQKGVIFLFFPIMEHFL
jgi:hypothetical protein